MEQKTRKDQLQAVWFAAGMAVIIACVERAVVVSIFKQWHMWIFLTLNLLLIAILFTSTNPKSHTSQETEKKQSPEVANNREDVVDDGNLNSEEKEEKYVADEEESEAEAEEEEDEGERSSSMLSNEELNEKVEAFISRFRQQYLVADVKIRRSSSGNVCGGVVFSKTITV